MEKAYQKAIWTLPDDFDSRETFERVVRRLEMLASPGYPYNQEATTNGQWLKWNGLHADPIQLERLWYDVRLVMNNEFQMYLRVFIKMEPHKKGKVQAKRWRLIVAAPLAVQVAWQMMFHYMNDVEIDQAYYIPSQQGLTLVGGGWSMFRRSWRERGLTGSLDKSAWDWTAPKWALDLDLEFRRRLARGSRISDWYKISKDLYENMFGNPIWMLTTGDLYKQIYPGIMKSGCVNTISTNSHCQVMLHLLVCFDANVAREPLPVCCGDDTLNHPMHLTLKENYSRYGIQIKAISETMEFMGHVFKEDGPRPSYVMKHLFKLPYTSDAILPEYLDSMARMYVHEEELFRFWETLARNNGTPLPLSRQAYLFWYNYAD